MGTSNLDRLIVSFPHCKPPPSSSTSSSSSSSQEAQPVNLVTGALKIQVPSSAEELEVANGEQNPKTPRSVEHKIPAVAACPPAPRKAKRVPTTGKRRACFPVVRGPAEFMVYMDAMLALNETVYVPDIVVGDLFAGNLVKRIRLLPPPAHEV